MTDSPLQVLVHLDASAATTSRLRAARALAARFDASIAALYAVLPSYTELAYGPAFAQGLAEQLVQLDAERLATARAAFDAEMKAAGPQATWGDASEMEVVGTFVQQALAADLLVLGQHEPEAVSAVPPDFGQSVVIGSGKPALVLPYVGWPRAIGDTVVIAWKDSRESARAVAAAMPLLRKARQVHVLSWGERAANVVRGHSLDLQGYLRQNGVEAQWQHQDEEPDSFGEILLSHAYDLDADLLVMGCYGHSRAREWMLGGASRTILQSMTLPVLMAH